MGKKEKKRVSFGWNIAIAVFANLLTIVVLAIVYLRFYYYSKSTPEQPMSQLLSAVAALVLWCIICGLVPIQA